VSVLAGPLTGRNEASRIVSWSHRPPPGGVRPLS
jgi:hypothetical protein